METIIGIVIAIVIAVAAYLFGRGTNGSGDGGVRDDLNRAGDAAERAGEGINKSLNSNRRAKKILERGRAILKKARERASKKDNSLGNG